MATNFVATVSGGGIYTWQATPSPNLSIGRVAGGVMLSWTIPSMNFTLQHSTNLNTTNWTNMMTPPVLNLTNLHNPDGSSFCPRPRGNSTGSENQ